VRLLLDTNALLWALDRPERLSDRASDAISSPANDIFVSPVSAWEISIKSAARKLEPRADLLNELRRIDFSPVAVTWEHGVAAGSLPLHHRDPFDRMLVAQAQLEGLTIVTSDERIGRYQVAVLPA
jgi:PIN domain nuclease of toxin-antitoxin system